MEAKCYRAMRRAEQRDSPRRIAKHPELSGLLPQFGTTSMKDDGGRNPRFAPVEFYVKGDGGRRAGFAHVNHGISAGTGAL